MYKSGDLMIPKETIINLLKSFQPGTYSTFDIIEKYQGIRARNKKTSANRSWNANFGKILMKCSKDTTGIIVQYKSDTKILIDGTRTSTSKWILNKVKVA